MSDSFQQYRSIGLPEKMKIEFPNFPLALWREIFFREMVYPPFFNFDADPKMIDSSGLDFFDINQSVKYDDAPLHETLQLTGHFDFNSIAKVLASKNYVKQPNTEFALWCVEKCLDGNRKRTEYDASNPFGGAYGYLQPVLMLQDTIISTPDYYRLKSFIETEEKQTEPLSTVSDFRAAIDVLTQDSILLRGVMRSGTALTKLQLELPLPYSSGLSQEDQKQLLKTALDNYQDLPTYTVIMIADTVTDTEQVAKIGLVFSNEIDAKSALEIISQRILTFHSLQSNESFQDMLSKLRVQTPEFSVVPSNNHYVLVIKFATPKASPEQILQFSIPPYIATPTTTTTEVTRPGEIYNSLFSYENENDMLWLSMIKGEKLKALLQD